MTARRTSTSSAASRGAADPQLLALAGAGLAAFDDPEAEPTLRAAALTGPDLAVTRLHYGAYLSREGMFVEALEQLEAAAASSRTTPSSTASSASRTR
jgi:Tfp pilus assembly protein PilF